MNELALFTGAGGGVLAGQLLGWSCIGACEIERFPRQVLLAHLLAANMYILHLNSTTLRAELMAQYGAKLQSITNPTK